MISAKALNDYRVIPRILTFCFGAVFVYSCVWFMGIPEPNAAQAGFISTMSASMTGVFGFYVKSGDISKSS